MSEAVTTYLYGAGGTPVSAGRGIALGASGQVWVSLLATEAELTEWNTRRSSGPFASTGDFDNGNATDDPNYGEWDHLVTKSSQTWSASRWLGPTNTTSGRVNRDSGGSNDPDSSTRTASMEMVGASFKALMDDRQSAGSGDVLAQAILDEINAQRQESNLDFGSRTQYPYDYYDDINPLFYMAWWVTNYVVAYSNVKALVGANANIEQWFSDLAYLCENAVHGDGSSNMTAMFPNRKTNDYITGRASFVDTSTAVWGQDSGGSDVGYMVHQRYLNNRRSSQAAFVGLVGALLDDATLIAEFERYMREWVGFSMNASTGSHGDSDRDSDSATLPQKGLWYAMWAGHHLFLGADALARLGYTTSYDQLVNIGSTHATWGTKVTNKTIQDAVGAFVGWIDESNATQVYTPTGGGHAGDSQHRRCPANPHGNTMYYWDSWVLRVAAYGQHAGWSGMSGWRDAVRRVGTPEGYDSLQNAGGITSLSMGLYTRFLDPYGIEGVY